MFYDARANDHGLAGDPFKALIGPRPIAWISTMSAEGVANLAPYSFFNAMAEDPHYVAFGSGGPKHTLANIRATGVFCINGVSADLAAAMNKTAAYVGPEVDEFKLANLSRAPCRTIDCPRVAASPWALECRLAQIVDLPQTDQSVQDWLVLGRVVAGHIDDRFIRAGRVDTAAMHLVGRLGYAEYATVESPWRMRRPD